MTEKYTVSLSRAHKLAERLTRHIDKSMSEIEGKTRYVTAYLPAQVDRALDIQNEIEDGIRNQEQDWEALIALRKTIAEANERVGIHSMLSAYKVRHRQVCSLEELLESALRFRSGVGPVDATQLLLDKDKNIDSVNINIVDDAFVAELRDDIQIKRNALDRLNDDINDLNGSTRVTLELSKRIASIVGL